MKIVYVLKDYTNSGGMERVISLKANYLAKHGFEVYIIACCHKDEKPFFYFEPEIRFYNLDIPGIRNKHKKIFIEKITTLFNEINPDIAISSGLKIINCLPEVQHPCIKIVEFHFSKYKQKYKLASLENNPFGRLFLKLYHTRQYNRIRKFDKAVLLTEEDRKSWEIHNLSNLEVIPNPQSFTPEVISDVKTKRIIAVGRCAKQKGYDILVDIWKEMERDYPEWKISIFGNGSKKRKLNKKILKYGLSERIEICSATEHIEKEYAGSSVLVMTSRYEGFPMVLIEAMSCGLPVVTFDYKAGPRDMISHGKDGFIVKMKHNKDFIDKLGLLITDEELRLKMGKAALKKAKNYEIDKVMESWIALFNQYKKDKSIHSKVM